MSNQVCPGVPDAAIGKVGVSSVSGGHGARDTFSDSRIDATRQSHRGHAIAKDVPLLHRIYRKTRKAMLSQGNRTMPQLFFFGLKFADNIHYK